MRTRIEANYTYLGLGFPVELENITMYETAPNEWSPKIDVLAVSAKVLREFLDKDDYFSGYELFFLRSYLKMSSVNFAKTLKVDLETVKEWENARDNKVRYSPIINQRVQELIKKTVDELDD